MTDKIEMTGQNNPVSEELVEAFARAIGDVDPGDNEAQARLYARAILTSPTYQAELQAAHLRGMEEAAGLALGPTHPHYCGGFDDNGNMLPGSPYDRGRADAADAIRSRMEKKS